MHIHFSGFCSLKILIVRDRCRSSVNRIPVGILVWGVPVCAVILFLFAVITPFEGKGSLKINAFL